MSKRNIVDILKGKKLQGLGFGDKVCEWCGVSTTVLDAHHYPISKKNGGKLTVNICANCHNEFHFPSPSVYTFHIRVSHKLRMCIEDYAKKNNKTISDSIKDILEDFFLDQKLIRQKQELEGI